MRWYQCGRSANKSEGLDSSYVHLFNNPVHCGLGTSKLFFSCSAWHNSTFFLKNCSLDLFI